MTSLRKRTPLALSICAALLSLLLSGCFGNGSENQIAVPGTSPSGRTLSFQVQPSNVSVGAVMTPSVQVAVRDANGTLVSDATTAITLALANNPGGATLGGIVTQNAVNGVATFPGLSLNQAGVGYTMAATATGVTSATSAAFNVNRVLSFGTPTQLTSNTPASFQTIASADFNQDGFDDLVTVDNNSVLVFLADPTGGFNTPVPVPASPLCTAVTVADFNNDGNVDIATAGGFIVGFIPGQAGGTFGAVVQIGCGNAGADLRGICVDNFDSAGLFDVAVTDASDNSIYVYRNDGGFAFTPQNFPSGGVALAPRAIAAGDMNGDGAPDLAIAGFGRPQTIWLNAGGNVLANLFPAANCSNVQLANATGACQTVAAADWNRDGVVDVFSPDTIQVAGQNEGDYFANNGNGTFAAPVTYRVGQDAFGSAAADFNLDGLLDIGLSTFVGLGGFGDLEVMVGNGDGTFQAVQAFPLANSESRSMCVGDFNNDGKPDAAVSNGNSWVFLNTTN